MLVDGSQQRALKQHYGEQMSIFTAVKDIERLRQITTVLARHGFGAVVARLGLPFGKEGEPAAPAEQGLDAPPGKEPLPSTADFGQRLRRVLEELGPTYVKLGQIISTRPDIIPEEIIRELKHLQDDVSPFSAQEARQAVQDCLGAPVEQVYESFTDKPLASASVAQVHRATLRVEGHDAPVQVAVKIQRPGIDATVQQDLNLLHILARLIEEAIPESRVYSPTGLVQEFDVAISAELDFTIEAINSARFIENHADDAAIHFPSVYKQASGKKVLTLEFLDGLKADEAVRRGADHKWIAENAVRLILKMVFEDGFFHADPHPGNILILPRPTGERYEPGQQIIFGLLDLGLVGRLSPTMRDHAIDLVVSAARQDADGIADAMLAMSTSKSGVDYNAFRRHVQRLVDRHLGGRGLGEMDASTILMDIVSGAIKFKLEIPVELTMMLRAVITMEGVGKELYPELDLLAVAKPYLTRIVMQRYSPQRMGNELIRNLGRFSSLVRDLPLELQGLIDDIRHGRVRVRLTDETVATATERAGKRVRAAIVSASLLGGGTALLVADRYVLLAAVMLTGSVLWMSTHLTVEFWSGILDWWRRRKERR